MGGRQGKPEIPEKTRRPEASSGPIPSPEINPVRLGVRRIVLTTTPMRPPGAVEENYASTQLSRHKPVGDVRSFQAINPRLAMPLHPGNEREGRNFKRLRGRGGIVVRLLVSHKGELSSIPGWFAPGFSHVGIVPDDAAGRRRAFLGISRLPALAFRRRCSTLTAFLPRWLLRSRVAQIPPPTMAILNLNFNSKRSPWPWLMETSRLLGDKSAARLHLQATKHQQAFEETVNGIYVKKPQSQDAFRPELAAQRSFPYSGSSSTTLEATTLLLCNINTQGPTSNLKTSSYIRVHLPPSGVSQEIRNARAGETGGPRENPSTSGIARARYPHAEICWGSNPVRLWGGGASSVTTTGPPGGRIAGRGSVRAKCRERLTDAELGSHASLQLAADVLPAAVATATAAKQRASRRRHPPSIMQAPCPSPLAAVFNLPCHTKQTRGALFGRRRRHAGCVFRADGRRPFFRVARCGWSDLEVGQELRGGGADGHRCRTNGGDAQLSPPEERARPRTIEALATAHSRVSPATAALHATTIPTIDPHRGHTRPRSGRRSQTEDESSETDLMTNPQCDKRTENLPLRRYRGASSRSLDYK
ncbi:hypothetical protein PR048_009731 [Dryococelus australis]|uniref:Uncharacterized protein n=1 Tax=Dryococelus australis TaxID=614101 RepID=A0ABQ9I0S1_9NEOP|nr:hypothetical protein PR048_009731 [Dryococelus australis]